MHPSARGALSPERRPDIFRHSLKRFVPLALQPGEEAPGGDVAREVVARVEHASIALCAGQFGKGEGAQALTILRVQIGSETRIERTPRPLDIDAGSSESEAALETCEPLPLGLLAGLKIASSHGCKALIERFGMGGTGHRRLLVRAETLPEDDG